MQIITGAKYTFEQLLTLLDNPTTDQEALLSQVAQDDNFWRQVTIDFYGRDKIERRLDILPNEWKAQAVALSLNVVSYYALLTPIDTFTGHLVLRYHGAANDPSKAAIAKASYQIPDGHQMRTQVRIAGFKPITGSFGYAVRSNFNDNDHRSVLFVCRSEDQLLIIYGKMIDSLAATLLHFYRCNRDDFGAGSRILDVVFNEAPTFEIAKAIIVKFLGIVHLNWELNPLRFASYPHSKIRERTLTCHKPDNDVHFHMRITIAEVVFP